MSLGLQNLGCYYIYENLEDEQLKEEIKKLLEQQTAEYISFSQMINEIYKSCIDKNGKAVGKPDMNLIMLRRQKLQERYLEAERTIMQLCKDRLVKKKKKKVKKY